MRKNSSKKLRLNRESLRGLDLQSTHGGVTQVDCTIATNCSLGGNCTVATNCTAGVDCSFVHTACHCTA